MFLPRELARGLLQLIYPQSCSLCGQALVSDTADFCLSCRSALTSDSHPACPRCAATVGPFSNLAEGCSHCRECRFHFEQAHRLGPYDGALRECILRLKYQGGEELAETMGTLWAEHAQAGLRLVGSEAVVPVPLHWWRRWTRGYNQSQVLAQALADRLGLPCRPGWLRRIRATPQQTRQTRAGRWQNVQGAFRARPRPELHGKTVLLVDDVLTTGSTCSEAARALRAAGANRVVVAVLAKSQG